jgi:hypothetical protein
VKRFATLALLGVILAGCGSGGGGGVYSRAKTEQCLNGKPGVAVDHDVDFVASTATGGAFHVILDSKNSATVVFGETVNDANNINDAYHRFRAKNVGVDDVIRQVGNAVLLFHVHPSDAEIATITDCLK